MTQVLTIPEFYRNKNVFITGGSGFIGKVLVEKLLRSCPDLQTIYLLMRKKKGLTPEERIKKITDLPLFDVVKSQNPEAVAKIKIVNGDVRELNLGVTPEDQKMLIEEVNIIFHVAASVRFDDSLTDAIIMNTRGARELVNLALQMKKLDVLEHISTTYCHTDHKVVDEKLYPPHGDWRKIIDIAEKVDKHVLDTVTEKFIQPLSNTYTFTKSLAEHVVYDLCKGKIPLVVYRPSVVVCSAMEPFPGWIDNFNGPMGLVAGFGKGVLRTVYCDADVTTDYIPVDLTVKAMIIASWKQPTLDQKQKLIPSFYNGSNNNAECVSTKNMLDMGKVTLAEHPLDYVLWDPNCTFTKCFYWYYILLVVFHLVPAVLGDCVLKIIGVKPMLLRLHRKIYLATIALSYFTFNEWNFCNDKCYKLQFDILPSDTDAFAYKEDEVTVEEFFTTAVIGIRKYLLKEGDNREIAKKHYKRMFILRKIFQVLWYLVLVWLFCFKINIFSLFVNKCNDVFLYFVRE